MTRPTHAPTKCNVSVRTLIDKFERLAKSDTSIPAPSKVQNVAQNPATAMPKQAPPVAPKPAFIAQLKLNLNPKPQEPARQVNKLAQNAIEAGETEKISV